MRTRNREVPVLLGQASRAAKRRGQRLSTAHLLLAIVQQGGLACRVLAEEGVSEAGVSTAIKASPEESDSCVELCIKRAERVATTLGAAVPTELHLLLSLLREPRSAAYRCLQDMGKNTSVVQQQALAMLGKSALKQEATSPAPPRNNVRWIGAQPLAEVLRTEPTHSETEESGMDVAIPRAPRRVHVEPRSNAMRPKKAMPVVVSPAENVCGLELDPKRYPMLTKLGRNLSAEAMLGRLDPVIGRDHEIEQLLDVLARRRANNPVLVGPPGVGKTAIVEGLAMRLAQGGIKQASEACIIEVSVGSLLAGTGVRGALTERVRAMVEELIAAQGKLILFVDEIHGILGGLDGVEEIASELKTALGRARFPCIGTTTEKEFSRHIERDPALMRRFQRVYVQEPSLPATMEILRGALSYYETYHGVSYEPNTIEDAVTLSDRYIHERHLPDKAISVLDMAGARAKRAGESTVRSRDVAQVISEQSKIPIERLCCTDASLLLSLETHLQRYIVGQNDAVSRVSAALRKGVAGFHGRGPLGVFLALGPTGVGKTELAKAVSNLLFPGTEATRFDMSEFSEAHAIARLLGAPPGYIGHEDGGQLTEAVRRRPYQLILLDEIDKAHRDVLLALLPLLDEGRLTDARGRVVDFTHTIIMMTSNFGSEVFSSQRSIGFNEHSEADRSELMNSALVATRRVLPPELWNRIDEPLVFTPLQRDDVREIARRSLGRLQQVMQQHHGIQVDFDDSVVELLLDSGGYDPTLGARPLERAVSRLVQAPLAEAMLGKTIGSGDRLKVRTKGGKLHLDCAGSKRIAITV